MSAASSERGHAASGVPCPDRAFMGQRQIAAREIRPGDHLPPQPALHGTRYQHDGFTVGHEERDVLAGMAVLPGRILLFGPSGTLDSVAANTKVTVRRGLPEVGIDRS